LEILVVDGKMILEYILMNWVESYGLDSSRSG